MSPATPLPPLPTGPVDSMDAAVTRMRDIGALLPPADGLACFNSMYLIVTEAVRSKVKAGFYADPDFMACLDVEFANRYLSAIDGYRKQPPTAARAWSVLLASRSDSGIAPIQFALAGLNAHINLDLALALISTSEDLGTTPDDGSHHLDFEKVNHTLADLDQHIRRTFEQGILLEMDHEFVGLENLVGTFSITAAREAAWINASVLWRVRGERFLYDPYVDSVDRCVAFAGRTLLTPLRIG